MTILRQRMLEDLRIRKYAATAVECYVRSVADFARHFNRPPDRLGADEIRSWQLFLLNEKKVKQSTYIQAVCGLRFFDTVTLNRKIGIERIPLPRYEKKLPLILSKEEVRTLLTAPRNLGHRAILATMYGAGLRVSEVAALKGHDLDRQRRAIWVRGNKDRQVMLAEPLRDLLAAYWRWKRPTDWLFPRRQSRLSAFDQEHFPDVQKSGRAGGPGKTGAFASPCLRHSSAGRRRQPDYYSETARALGSQDLHVSDLALHATESPLETLGSMDLIQTIKDVPPKR